MAVGLLCSSEVIFVCMYTKVSRAIRLYSARQCVHLVVVC